MNLGRPYRVFLDTETGGLDPTRHDLLEVAILRERFYPDGSVALESVYSAKVLPCLVGGLDPEAVAVNGYSPERWEADGAEQLAVVMARVKELLTDAVIVGHNVAFDMAFINAAMTRVLGEWNPSTWRTVVDTYALAYARWGIAWEGPGELKSLSMKYLRPLLGISPEGAHGALKDAEDCRAVFYAATAP